MTTDNTIPTYRLTRLSYIPRAPGEIAEVLEIGTEIAYLGRPGSNLLPTNTAAWRALGRAAGDIPPAAERLAEMEAEREAIWASLVAAQAERNRLLADDPKSADLKKLRGRIDDLKASHREFGEAIEAQRSRSIEEIDNANHAAAMERRRQAFAFLERRAALVTRLRAAAGEIAAVMLDASALGSAAIDLAGAGLDLDARLTLAGVSAAADQHVADWVLNYLVAAQALPADRKPATWPDWPALDLNSVASAIESIQPEHPATRRARTQASVDHARAAREHYDAVQRRGRAQTAAMKAEAGKARATA